MSEESNNEPMITIPAKKAGAIIGAVLAALMAGFGGSYLQDRIHINDYSSEITRLEDKIEKIDQEGSRAVLSRIEECRGRITSLESSRTEIGSRLGRIEDMLQQVLLRLGGKQ